MIRGTTVNTYNDDLVTRLVTDAALQAASRQIVAELLERSRRAPAGRTTVPADGDALTLTGMATPFWQPVPASPPWTCRYQFAPGAFLRVITTLAPVKALVSHQHELALASTGEQTLALWEGHDGLMFRVSGHSRIAQQAIAYARDHPFTAVSVGFKPDTSSSIARADDVEVYTEVSLNEISFLPPHTPPRFAGTWARVMSAQDSWRLERASMTTVQMLTTAHTSYGGRERCFHAGQAYQVPRVLAQRLTTGGQAR